MKPHHCPKCEQHLLLYNTCHQYTAEDRLVTTSFYHCENCGYEETETIQRQMPEETAKEVT